MTTVHSTAFPLNVEVAPGQGGLVSVSVTNTSDVIDAYQIQVFGLDPAWTQVSPPRLSLFPGETKTAEIRVTLPVDYPSSQRNITVNVVSDNDPTSFNLTNVELLVSPQAVTDIALDPTLVTAGRAAVFGLVVTNSGNAVAQATGFAVDPEDLAEFTFDPPSVIVAPGRSQVIRIRAQGGRSWFGQARARNFTFGVDSTLAGSPADLAEVTRSEIIGTFVQRPRIPRWLFSLIGLLTAAAIFAAVLSRSFDRVVERATVSDEIIDAALDNEDAAGAVVPADPATLSGTIGTETGAGALAGAQVELFPAGDTTTPVASAVTDEQGGFTLSNLADGTYKMKVSGAGLEPVWYPAGAVPSEGQDIVISSVRPNTLEPVAIGGIPVELSGTVAADDPSDLSGVTVSLVVPSQSSASGSALVATTDVAPDGSFVLPDVPSPGQYELLVEKPGFATERRDVVVEPGEGLGDLQVALLPGEGIISGSVSDENGAPLGGATVRAANDSTEADTVSLTEGAVGTFRVRNLPTPGQYTVTVSRDGYMPETRTVSLAEGQLIGSFTARLVPATGAITGAATINGAAAPGLEVTLTGGDVVRTSAVVSQGPDAGSYSFSALPAPATYTLTFTGPDVVPQVRVVSLDPSTSSPTVGGVNVSLSPERTVVSGTVLDVDGTAEPQATVVLSDGTTDVTFSTADEPAGRFEFSDVAPGAYTLTASRPGTNPVVRLVNVSPTSGPPVLSLQLGVQASLSGQVIGYDPTQRTLTLQLFDPALFPNGDPIATTQTDTNGSYRFPALDAPTTYVVAVYASETAADALDSVAIETQPGADKAVPTFDISTP